MNRPTRDNHRIHARFDVDAARRIGEAVREVEGRSAAELVVEVRARSGPYAHADARFAAALAFVSLAVLVFMPITVPPFAVLVDAFAFFFAGLAIARRSDALRRLFTTPPERLLGVRTQAAALFHDRGVANTSGETGVVLYVSLLERRIEVLADRGVLRKVVANEWNAALAELHVERPLGPEDVIAAIRRLGAILERDLPGSDDLDELPNEVACHETTLPCGACPVAVRLLRVRPHRRRRFVFVRLFVVLFLLVVELQQLE